MTHPPIVVVVGRNPGPIAELAREVAESIGVTLDVRGGGDIAPTAGILIGDPAGILIGDTTVPADAPRWHVEAALLRALAPRHVLFLCVANSARSQLAHGLARGLAPPTVRVSSAGSTPTSVRPQAVEALKEVGIDIGHHRSTAIDEVERPVDAVITLCAEEVCPVWLGSAWRLHWGLPDPAAAEGSESEKLDAFRAVREELSSRLAVLFGAAGRQPL